MNLNTDYLTQGSSSSKIVDAWVSIDNKYLGTYGLPVTFPALAEGNYKISFRAGVQVNGMTDNRAAYPPFATFDTTLNYIPGSTLVLNPTVSYKAEPFSNKSKILMMEACLLFQPHLIWQF